MAKSPAKDAKSQRQKFIEAAREIGCEEDERKFERQLEAIAGADSSAGNIRGEADKSRDKKSRKGR